MTNLLPDFGSLSAGELWEQAFSRLDGSVKPQLLAVKDNDEGKKLDVVAALMKTVEEKRRWCIQRQWKFKTPGGKVVILRDVLEKMAKWLDRFKVVIDTAVQYDPGHAALPWAAIRFILQVAVDEIQAHGSILLALEAFTRILGRCARAEELHTAKKKDLATSEDIREALTRLYAAILTSLSVALKYFQKSHGGRLFAVVIEPAAVQSIEEQEKDLFKVLSLAHSELLQDLDTQVHRIVDVSTMIQTSLNKQESIDFLSWLSSTRVHDHHASAQMSRIMGTASWITQHETYQAWFETSYSSILVLRGIRGCGKTVLMSAIVEALKAPLPSLSSTTAAAAADEGDCSSVPCAFFYCANPPSEPDRSSPAAILRSLIRQLAVTSKDSYSGACTIDDKVWTVYKERLSTSQPDRMDLQVLDCEDCLSLLLEMTLTNPAYLVIDAVDELPDEARAALLDVLQRLVDGSGSLVKVAVSSRDNTQVEALLPVEVFSLRISEEMTANDMKQFVDTQVGNAIASARLLNGRVRPDVKAKLVDTMMANAGEMFQWVILQVDYLCTLASERDVLAAMETGLLATLDELYSAAFSSILSRGLFSQKSALTVFSWLLYGKAALTRDTLRYTLTDNRSVAEREDVESLDLIAICGNLILHDTALDVYRFCHSSVSDFLRLQPELDPRTANEILAKSCLDECINGEPTSPLPASVHWRNCPLADFYLYAGLHWWEHVRESKSNSGVHELLNQFIFDASPPQISVTFLLWLDWIAELTEELPLYHPQKRLFVALSSQANQPLFTACQFGLDGLAKHYLDADPDFDTETTNAVGHTAIYLAAAAGFTDIVILLAQRKADVNVQCGRLGSPLQAACFHGHAGTISALLELGASPGSPARFQNALEAACRGSRPEAALLLLKHDAVLETTVDYELALQWSTEHGLETVVDALLKPEYQNLHKAPTDQITSMMSVVIRSGSIKNLERLLRIKAASAVVVPEDAVALAAYHGNVEMVTYFKERGMSLYAEGTYGTPLRSACLSGHEVIARLLIGWGASVNFAGKKGHALQAAAMNGHVRLVALLIAEGAEVDVGGWFGKDTDPLGSSLEVACYYGHLAVVETLLQAGAYVGHGGYFKGAMHAAIEGGQAEIATYLVQKGYTLDEALARDYTLASRMLPSPGRERQGAIKHEKCKLASGYGSYCHHVGKAAEMGAFELCAASGNLELMRQLMMQMDDLGPLDYQATYKFELGLKEAAANGSLPMVEFLTCKLSCVQHSAFKSESHVGCHTFFGPALVKAASHGHVSIVDCLAKALDDITTAGRDCRTCGAALLEEHADNNKDRYKGEMVYSFAEALKEAAKHGHKDVMEMLIGHLTSWGRRHIQLASLVQVVALYSNELRLQPLLDEAAAGQSQSYYSDTIKDAMLIAGTAGNLSVVRYIIRRCEMESGHPGVTHEALYFAFIGACRRGRDETALACISVNEKYNLSDQEQLEGLMEAAMGRESQTVARIAEQITWTSSLINGDAGLTRDAFTAIVAHGYIDIAHRILELVSTEESQATRADFLRSGLVAACFQRSLRAVRFCIQCGADVNGSVIVSRDVYQDDTSFMGEVNMLSASPDGATETSTSSSTVPGKEDHCASDMSMKLRAAQAVVTSHCKYLWGYEDEEQKQARYTYFLDIYKRKVPLAPTAAACRMHRLLVNDPWDGSIFTRKNPKEQADPISIMLVLMSGNVQLEPTQHSNSLHDMLSALRRSVPFGASARWREYMDINNPWDAKTACDALDGGSRDLLVGLFERLPSLQAHDEAFVVWLYMAAAAGDRPMLDLLIDKGVDVNEIACSSSALNVAAEMGQTAIMGRLLEAGAAASYDDGSMLDVVSGGHVQAFEMLIAAGLEIPEEVAQGDTWNDRLPSEEHSCLVCHALRSGQPSILSRLLDMTRQQHNHTRALIEGCRQGKAETVDCIIQRDSKTNIQINGTCWIREEDIPGGTWHSALTAACQASRLDVAKSLVARGADVNMPAESDSTIYPYEHVSILPLMEAIAAGNLEIVQLLLDHGAILSDPPTIPNAFLAAMDSTIDDSSPDALGILELLLKAAKQRGAGAGEELWKELLVVAVTTKKPKFAKLILQYFPVPSD